MGAGALVAAWRPEDFKDLPWRVKTLEEWRKHDAKVIEDIRGELRWVARAGWLIAAELGLLISGAVLWALLS